MAEDPTDPHDPEASPLPVELDSQGRFPVSQSNLTPEEIKLLADPDWIDEDEADYITCKRRENEGAPAIPIEEVMRKLGVTERDLRRKQRVRRSTSSRSGK
jgi:hypothetical protein